MEGLLSTGPSPSSLLSPINLVAAWRLFLYGVTLVFPDHSPLEVSQPTIIAVVSSLSVQLCSMWYSVVQFIKLLNSKASFGTVWYCLVLFGHSVVHIGKV